MTRGQCMTDEQLAHAMLEALLSDGGGPDGPAGPGRYVSRIGSTDNSNESDLRCVVIDGTFDMLVVAGALRSLLGVQGVGIPNAKARAGYTIHDRIVHWLSEL